MGNNTSELDFKSLLIENSIPQETKLKEGIFFTKESSIELICKKLDFTNVKTVIDTASGSCNFLIYLAKIYPNIKFYGIEKNLEVFEQSTKLIKEFDNIELFHGDTLFDNFSIPKCDLYLSNPPWVNYLDLEETYRSKIKDLWLENFKVDKGFKLLLGDSRGDLSQLFMNFSIKKYLKENGKFAVVMPLTAIRSKNTSSSDFRSFDNYKVEEISEITNLSPFANTQRSSCVIVGVNSNKTTFPIPYHLYKDLNTIEKKELVKNSDSLIFSDEMNIIGKSDYIARQGVNTLGANDVFFFKEKPTLTSNIIKRLLKSSDITKWKCEPSYWILFPYTNKKCLTPTELQNYPDEFNYFQSKKETLTKRKSKLIKDNFYQLFGVGDYTFTKFKVVWRGLGAKKLQSVVIGEDIIPNQSMNCYISTDDEQEAYYICGIMNSEFFELQLLNLCESGSKSFGQPNVINNLKIKKFDPNNSTHNEISLISKKFHKSGTSMMELRQLENLVRSIY